MEKPRHHLNSKSVRTLRINGLENTYDAIRNGFQASLGDSVLQIFTMGTQQEYHFRLESLRDTLFFSHSKKFYHDYPIISNFPKLSLCILLDQPYDYISPKRATMHKTKGKTDNSPMEE